MESTRREFAALGVAGALSAGLLTSAAAAAPQVAGSDEAAKPWHQRVRRMIQINTNMHDLGQFDVEVFVRYLTDCHADVALLSLGNIGAFYPTRVENYPIAPGLGKRDLVGECVKALRAQGIRIIGRLSPDMAAIQLSHSHPEWFRRAKDGQLVAFYEPARETPPGTPETGFGVAQNVASLCPFTSYYSEVIPAIMTELTAPGGYALDGFFLNGWPPAGVFPCYCGICRKIGDPASVTYRDAVFGRSIELNNLYQKTVRDQNPEAVVQGGIFAGILGTSADMHDLIRQFPWFMADHQSRDLTEPVWDVSQVVRLGRATMKDRPVMAATGARNTTWRHASGEAAEVTSRMIQSCAAGGAIWYHWLGFEEGFRYDRRWQKTGSDFMAWQARNDEHFRNRHSLANLGVVIAPFSNRFYKAPDGSPMQNTLEAVFAILLDARIPFDLVREDDLGLETIGRYKALLLPNFALMSDRQKGQIAAYVDQGGSLVSTFETGVYDETGKLRADFALGELFGIRRTGDRAAYMRTSPPGPGLEAAPTLQRIERRHPILASFRDTAWIQGAGWTVPFESDAAPLLRQIPAYPSYPTELSITPVERAQRPTAIAREKDGSRLVYLSMDIAATYWKSGGGDLADLLANSLRWALSDTMPVRVDGEGLVEIFGWRTEPGYAVHLINYHNPHTFRANMRRVAALGPQTVRLTLDEDVRIRSARLLRAEKAVAFHQNGRTVEVIAPELRDYEVVALIV